MDADLLVVYLAEVRSECRLALQAEADLLARTAKRKIILVEDEDNLTDDERRQLEERNADFLRAHINVQAMLAHAAAVSKLLRPGNGRWKAERQARAAELAAAIGVSEEQIDSLARGLRNDLEHYDERLYEWSGLPSTNLYHMPPSRGLTYALDPYNTHIRDLSRSYHPGAHLYTFWSDTYDLNETSAALKTAHDGAGRAMHEILTSHPDLFAEQDA